MPFVVPNILEQISLEFSQEEIGYRDRHGLEQVPYFGEDCHHY